MGREWVCMLLCCSQIQYIHMVTEKETRDLRGLSVIVIDPRKKPKDLSVSEREDREHGEGVSTEDVRESTLCTYDVVCSRKAARHL